MSPACPICDDETITVYSEWPVKAVGIIHADHTSCHAHDQAVTGMCGNGHWIDLHYRAPCRCGKRRTVIKIKRSVCPKPPDLDLARMLLLRVMSGRPIVVAGSGD